MSPKVYFFLLVPFVILSLVALVVNCLYGLYILAQTIAYRQFMLMFVSLINLLFWGGITFASFFVFYISGFSESLLIKPVVILLYLLIGLVVFWGFRILDKSIL